MMIKFCDVRLREVLHLSGCTKKWMLINGPILYHRSKDKIKSQVPIPKLCHVHSLVFYAMSHVVL